MLYVAPFVRCVQVQLRAAGGTTEHVGEPELGAGEMVATYSSTGLLLSVAAFQVTLAPVSARVALTPVGASGTEVTPPSLMVQPSFAISAACAVLAAPNVNLLLPASKTTFG